MLNQQQKASVNSDALHKAIIAGAGTGKTTTIVQMIKKDSLIINPKKMVAITFTRFAAEELKSRLEKAGVDTNELFTGTIHSFALYLLQTYGYAIGIDPGFQLFDGQDREDILNYVLKDTLLSKLSLKKVLEDEKHKTIKKRLLSEYDQLMQQFNALDLTMLIEKAIVLLKSDISEEIKASISAMYIDEFQDTNTDQIKIIKLINPERLTVIGDPDQSIYEWNGARPECLVYIKSIFPQMEIFKLETNYRSKKTVVKLANSLIEHNRLRIPKTLVPNDDSNGIVKHYVLGNELEQLMDINKIIGEEKTATIICRKNATAEKIFDYLTKQNVNVSLMTSGNDIFKSQAVKDILAISRYAYSQNDYMLAKVAPIIADIAPEKAMFYYEKAIIEGKPLLSVLNQVCSDFDLQHDKLSQLMDKIAQLDADGFTDMVLKCVPLQIKYQEEHRTNKMTDIQIFKSKVKDWCKNQNRSFADPSLKNFLHYVMLRDIQEAHKGDKASVKIMTVHGSKGLEFDNVIIPNFFQGEYPMTRSDNIEEERRLAYVAITRAKNNLYFTRPAIRRVRGTYELACPESQFRLEMM